MLNAVDPFDEWMLQADVTNSANCNLLNGLAAPSAIDQLVCLCVSVWTWLAWLFERAFLLCPNQLATTQGHP